MQTPPPDEQRGSEARALARTTALAPQRWGFLPTPAFWRQPGALDHAKWLFIVILVVGALPYAAAGLPFMTSFLVFGGLCYFALGLLERYVRKQADRRAERALRGAPPVDDAERRESDQGPGGG